MRSANQLAVAAALAAAGCTTYAGQTVDVPASELTVSATVTDDSAVLADGQALVTVQFVRNGVPVELASTTTVSCNNVLLTWNSIAYAGNVPLLQTHPDFEFVHLREGVSSTVDIAIPSRPVVTSPTSGATVPRNAVLTVDYIADSSAGVTPVASAAGVSSGANEQPDNGAATIDPGALKAGPGSVFIVRRLVSTPTGTGFAAASATYDIASAPVSVTWQ